MWGDRDNRGFSSNFRLSPSASAVRRVARRYPHEMRSSSSNGFAPVRQRTPQAGRLGARRTSSELTHTDTRAAGVVTGRADDDQSAHDDARNNGGDRAGQGSGIVAGNRRSRKIRPLILHDGNQREASPAPGHASTSNAEAGPHQLRPAGIVRRRALCGTGARSAASAGSRPFARLIRMCLSFRPGNTGEAACGHRCSDYGRSLRARPRVTSTRPTRRIVVYLTAIGPSRHSRCGRCADLQDPSRRLGRARRMGLP